jgi:hypothetical protein
VEDETGVVLVDTWQVVQELPAKALYVEVGRLNASGSSLATGEIYKELIALDGRQEVSSRADPRKTDVQ